MYERTVGLIVCRINSENTIIANVKLIETAVDTLFYKKKEIWVCTIELLL
jgi:hypothetical protein